MSQKPKYRRIDSFKWFTFKIANSKENRCRYCADEIDTPEHNIFICAKLENFRKKQL